MHGTIGIQSHKKSNITIHGANCEKGVGYFTIFENSSRKFELSLKETVMRLSLVQNKQKYEYLLQRVSDRDSIKKIEYRSSKWYFFENGDWIIMEQKNKEGKRTGNYKIVLKSGPFFTKRFGKHAEVLSEDWKYYTREKRTDG